MSKARSGGGMTIYSETSHSVNGKRERTRKRLGTADDPHVRAVAEAKYLDRLRRNLEENGALLEKMLKKYRPYGREDIIGQLPAVYGRTIIGDTPVRILDAPAGREWMEAQILHNPREFASKSFAVDGTPVRSKNEALIYNIYMGYGVPVRYEDLAVLRDASGRKAEVYTDFSILAADGRILRHEHFGMLDMPQYRERSLEKLALYLDNGYVLWDDLFITVDGQNHSIDTEAVDRMIRAFILPKI
ncbi:MAG: hypothetical protein K5774_02095 [Clostridia bacterium]|nr:hypothetical protein [Clostridia bacterium]